LFNFLKINLLVAFINFSKHFLPLHFFQDAIIAARSERGFSEYYPLHLPATSERIRMACTDDIAKLCISDAAAQKGVEQFQPLASC